MDLSKVAALSSGVSGNGGSRGWRLLATIPPQLVQVEVTLRQFGQMKGGGMGDLLLARYGRGFVGNFNINFFTGGRLSGSFFDASS